MNIRTSRTSVGVALLAMTGLIMVTNAGGAATIPRVTTPTLPPPAPAPAPNTFTPLGLDVGHAGFPTAAIMPNGTLRLMWRHGSSHASTDGEIVTSTSVDRGVTWTPPTHVSVDGGGDVRDPHLGPSAVTTLGPTVFLTYFVSVNGVPQGARVARSTDNGVTFGPSVRIDPNLPWAAISGPVIQVGTTLYAGFYGRKAGETVDSAYAAWSTDNGDTWASVRIAYDPAQTVAYQEPWPSAGANGSVIFMMRDGTWSNLGQRVRNANGTWSAYRGSVLKGATGNSANVRATNGRLYLVYRDTVTRAAKLASSGDDGVTWVTERELMPEPTGAPSTIGMTYAHPIEISPGYIFCPLGMERSDTDSRLYIGWL